jgi:hypothetical protein
VELATAAPRPDVVGDRRLLRFLRGHSLNVENACAMFRKFLKFREEYKVDEVRDRIRTPYLCIRLLLLFTTLTFCSE